MEERWYRYFLVAARLEHLGQAADEIGISQPALSRCIQKIEEAYGGGLFDRTGRRLRLNAAGRVMQQRVSSALAQLEDGRRELAELRADREATISIGFLGTLGVDVIPALVEGFRREHAEAKFRLLQGSHPALHKLLLAGEIDLCISSPRFADAKLQWRELYEEPLLILAPIGHPVAALAAVNLADLASEAFVALSRGYGLRHHLDEFATAAGFSPQIAVETEEVPTLVGLVSAGLGLALAPASAEWNRNRVAAVRVVAPVCRRSMGLSWRAGRYMSGLTLAFKEHALAAARAIAALAADPMDTPHAVRPAVTY